MEKYTNVVDHATFSVALVMCSFDVIACDEVVVGDFAVVRNSRNKWTGLTVANVAYLCIVLVHLLLNYQRSHFAVLVEMVDDFCLPLYVLVE